MLIYIAYLLFGFSWHDFNCNKFKELTKIKKIKNIRELTS